MDSLYDTALNYHFLFESDEWECVCVFMSEVK